MSKTSRIHSLISRARRRLKLQSAIEVATTMSILTSAAVLAVVYGVRGASISEGMGIALLIGCLGFVVLGAVIGAMRQFPSHVVATRIDRASGLSDRLSNACAFEHRLEKKEDEHTETVAMMELAVKDAHANLEKADVKSATPFRKPADGRVALTFGIVALAVAGLWWPNDHGGVALGGVDHSQAGHNLKHHHKTTIELEDEDLGYAAEIINKLDKLAEDTKDAELKKLVKELRELLDKVKKGQLSKNELMEKLDEARDKYLKDTEFDSKETMKDLAETGKELEKTKETRELGKALKKGDLNKAQKEMKKLADKNEKLGKKQDENKKKIDELKKKLKDKKLSDKQKKDLKKKLAKLQREQKKIDKKQDNMAKALKRAADKFQKRQQKKDKKADKQIANLKKQIRRLQRQMDKTKNPQMRSRIQRRLQQRKRQLKTLQRKQNQRHQSAHRRQLQRLHRNMRTAAKNMQNMRRQQNPQKRRMQRRQASRRMKDAQRNIGKVSKDMRRVRNKRKVASQLDDLRDAMRRARQRGRRGQRNRFGRNRRNGDFNRRAKGRRGSRKSWRPGNRPGQGKGKGGQKWGTGDGGNPLGNPTPMSGNTKDTTISGVQSKHGPSQRETVLSAAQKGFANRRYKKIYVKYKKQAEEIIHAEKVPRGYKYYIERYFQKIKPRDSK